MKSSPSRSLPLSLTESIAIASLDGVSFNSTNLQNVVVWNPGVEGTRYSVEYAMWGRKPPQTLTFCFPLASPDTTMKTTHTLCSRTCGINKQ